MGKKADKRTIQNLLEDNALWVNSEQDRTFLKNFNNVEHKPLLKGKTGVETPTMDLLPIPGLHCIKLGPVNHLMKHLKKFVDTKDFEKRHSLIEEMYHGGQYIGPDCEKIFSKLDDLEEEVKKQNVATVAFVDALRDLKEVNIIANQEKLNPNHRKIIKNLKLQC